MEFLMKDVAL